MRRWKLLSALVALPLVASACVYPVPPAGAPVPSLTLTSTSSGAGLLTVRATPANFTPTEVQFRVDTWGGSPILLDTTAPFEVTIYTADHGAGPKNVNVLAKGGGYIVGETLQVQLRQPNFVFVLLDDLDDWATPYWTAMPQTKALVSDRGLDFQNAFVVDPVCCPSRATFLTGKYPHNTGVFANTQPDGGYRAFRDGGAENDTMATQLKGAGYRTAFVGKYLNGYESDSALVPPGWDEWFAITGNYLTGYDYSANHNGVTETYGSNPQDYQTDVLADRAVDFINAAEANDAQPFLLAAHPVAPHQFIPPAPRHLPNPFGNLTLPARPNFNEADVSDKPTWIRDGHPIPSQAEIDAETNDYRRFVGSLLAVDDMVADIASTLQAKGEWDDTVIVFTSDNGYNWLSHRLFNKMAPYEESIAIPFAIAGPGIRTGTASELVTNLDLAPTFLNLAGVPLPSNLDGRTLTPLLYGRSTSWRTNFLVELNGSYFPLRLHTFADVQNVIANFGRISVTPTYRALRTSRYLYVEWYWGTPHEYELYDLAVDPYQLDNLVATPQGAAAHAQLTALLQARLDTLKSCAGATCRT